MPSIPPSTAEAPEIRPPIFRYFRVSTTASSRTRPEMAWTSAAIRAADLPWSRSITAYSTSRPSPKVTAPESTTKIWVSSTMSRAIEAD